MALVIRQRVVAAKIEGTPGTAEVLADADGAENFFDPNPGISIAEYQREGQGALSPIKSVPGARSGNFSVRTELYNSGTSTPPFWWSVLLPPCGINITGSVATPDSDSTSTLTAGCYIGPSTGANLMRVCGAMGNLSMAGDKVGEPIKMNWTYNGLYLLPENATPITPAYPYGITPLRFAGGTITIGGVAYVVSKFQFDTGNTLTLREHGNETTGGGYAGSIITQRRPRLSATIEAPLISTHDFTADVVAATEVAFVATFGTGTNGQVKLSIPKLQIVTPPGPTDISGIYGHALEFGCNRNSAAGDDEFKIELL